MLIMMLLRIKGIGGQSVQKIMPLLSDFTRAVDKWETIGKIPLPTINKAVTSGKLSAQTWGKAYLDVTEELKQAKKLNIKILNYLDTAYPQQLLKLKHFPVIVYVKGNIKLLNAPKRIAIVGTRTPSTAAIDTEIQITKQVSQLGYVVISGLAKGCDTYAHRFAKETIAVLAHGLDRPTYPAQNATLAARILEQGGTLFSTYPLGTKLKPAYLAARDEWESGLSDGVIVVETGATGGTQITIDFARKQGKPLGVLRFQQAQVDNFRNDPVIEVISNRKTLSNFLKKIQT